MSRERCRVLLGLVPAEEEAISDALYGSDAVSVVASGADARELLALAASHPVEAVLLSAGLPGLDAAQVVRLRGQGVRTAGLALDGHAFARLRELDLDVIVEAPLVQNQLVESLLDDRGDASTLPSAPNQARRPMAAREREGSVLAVVGSKGAPGSSELAASFAALVAREWQLLLCELDGDGGHLALRLGADPREGSLLGLARALKASEPDPAALLSHWLIDAGRGWPSVLLGSPDPSADLADATVPGMVERILSVLAAPFPLVVCDVGQRLRRSSGDPDAATRLHRDVLATADVVVLVIGSRQEQLRAGLAQLELLLDELAIGPERLRVVVNGQPGTGAPRKTDTAAPISQELAALGLTVDAWLPYDEKAQRASVRLGVPLAVAQPRGAYARAVRQLVEGVLLPGMPQPIARKRRLRPQPRVQPPAAAPATAGEVTLPWRQ